LSVFHPRYASINRLELLGCAAPLGSTPVGVNEDFKYSGVVALYPGFGLTAGPVPVGAAFFKSNTATFKIPWLLAWAPL
jgi:hypothetical protein